jgi:RNA polymerase sigma factor (sigma-70 family)
MRRQELHLVDENHNAASPAIAQAVEAAYRWAVVMFPHIDTALLANAAERLAMSMENNKEHLGSPRRYAYAAMHGKVRDWLRKKAANELPLGLDYELDEHARINNSFQDAVERSILFQQLQAKLNARDRYILILLTERNATPRDVATALGINYKAATKAIERIRERVALCLDLAAESPKAKSPGLSTTKGLTKKWI